MNRAAKGAGRREIRARSGVVLATVEHANIPSCLLASIPQPGSTQTCTSIIAGTDSNRHCGAAWICPWVREQLFPSRRSLLEAKSPPGVTARAMSEQLHRRLGS